MILNIIFLRRQKFIGQILMGKKPNLLAFLHDFFSWKLSAAPLFLFTILGSLTVHAAEPAITLQGSNPTTIFLNTTYVDAGATAIDDANDSVTVDIDASSVDTSKIGSYTVNFTAADSASPPNTGTATRTVKVIIVLTPILSLLLDDDDEIDPDADHTRPVITVIGGNPVLVFKGQTYSDAGATAFDSVDGSLFVSDNAAAVDTSIVKTYNVHYSAQDSSGNIGTADRTVEVIEDTTAPVITLNGDNPVTILVNSDYTDAGATATDNVDGNITVTFDDSLIDTATVGTTQTLEFTATDLSGNTSMINRAVHVIDNIAPVIILLGSNPVTVDLDSDYTDAGATVTDNADENVTVDFDDSEIVTSPVGSTQTLDFTATDASGNTTTVSRTIFIEDLDTTAPFITLNGINPVTIELDTDPNSQYTDAGAIGIDDRDGFVEVSINSSAVNIGIPGNYTVNFEATDAAGNTWNTTTRTVIVEAVPNLGELIGQWHLGENTGAIANDTSANTNDLTLNNMSQANWVTGKSGSALNFEAINLHDVSSPSVTDALRPASVTLSAWVKYNSNPVAGSRDWEWIAAQGDNYGLYLFPNNQQLVFYKRDLDKPDSEGVPQPSWSGVDSGTISVSFDQWHHVVGTLDASDAPNYVMKVYLDGVEVGSKTLPDGINYVEGNGFTIGSMLGQRMFNGVIDEVNVYDTAHTTENISYLMQRSNVDTLAPVITLEGPTTLNIVIGTSYTELGAIATDNIDGSVAVASDAVFSVDAATLGTYNVSYLATDTAGNTAKLIRTVNVITADVTSPVITLNGADSVNVAVNSTYVDQGATATDDVDITVTVDVDITNVDTTTAGTYTVDFTATDAAGNTATHARAVNVLVNPPVDESVFVGTYDGTDKPVEGRRGSIEFNDYVDPDDPGVTADWLTQSSSDTIITVSNDAELTAALQTEPTQTTQPGTRIQLNSGVYKMQAISISGTANNPITIESTPGQWAIFDGAKAGSAVLIKVDNTAWLNFRNFEIRNGIDGSIYIEHSHHHLYEGLKIHNNARGFDFTNGSSHSLIRYNESYHNFSIYNHGQDGDGFGVWSEGQFNDPIGEGVILEHNIAWGNSDDGIDMYKNEATVTLRNNIVRNNGFNVLNDPEHVGNGNGYKLGPYGEDDAQNPGRTGHYVIGNIADQNPTDGFDSNGGTALHYLRGNIATINGVTDYEVPYLNAASKDNSKTGGIFPTEVNPGQ